MKINKQAGPPEDLLYFDDEVNLTPLQVEDVVEIFSTPLTGSYNWDYTVVDDRIKKLYELGKKLNWNVSDDLDWSQTHPKNEFLVNQDFRLVPDEIVGLDELTMEQRLEMDRHQVSWNLSQFLHHLLNQKFF